MAHLSRGVFPSTVSRSSWLTDPAELPPLLRGDRASAGAHGIPVLDTSAVADRKQLSDKISEHRRLLDRRRVDEERRLLYVAVTRAEDTLLVSGHHWGPTGTKPRGPSEFLCELKDIIDRSAAAGDPCGVVEQWASAPAGDERNPLCDNAIEAVWPADPLAARRGDVERGAALVAAAMSADLPGSTTDIDHPRARAMPPGPLTSMHCWLNVRTRRGEHLPVVCRTICRSAVWWSWSATRSVRGSG